MKKTMRLLAIICVFAMTAVIFTGCKDNPDEYSYYSEIIEIENSKPDEGTEDGESSPTQTDSTTSTPEVASGKVDPKDYRGKTVTFATWDRADGIDLNKLISDFRQKYGINVQVKNVAQATYVQEVFALNQSGQGPDIVRNWDYWPAFTTIAQPIDVSKIDLSSAALDQAHIKASTVNGKTYSVTHVGTQHGLILYYNKKLLKANGFRTPDEYAKIGQWNVDAITNIMNQVKGLGKTYFGGYIDYYGMRLVDAYNTGIYKYENGKFSSGIADTAFEKVSVKVAEWNQAGLLSSNRTVFSDGKAGIAITDNYGLKKSGYWKDMNGSDIGFIELPENFNGATYRKNKMFTGFGIGKKSKEPVAAGIFLEYFLSPDVQLQEKNFISSDAFSFNAKVSGNSSDIILTLTSGPNNVLAKNKGDILREIAFTAPAQIQTLLKSKQNEINADIIKLNEYVVTNTK